LIVRVKIGVLCCGEGRIARNFFAAGNASP